MADNPLMSRFIEQPAMLAPEMANVIEAQLVMFMALEHSQEMLAAGGGTDEGFWPPEDSWASQLRPYTVKGGVLTIPVKGVLLNNFSYATGYATGYQYLARAWARGMSDPNVKGVVLSIDSGGGEASGNIDLVDKMVATKTKPVAAVAEHAYSAAYAIATAADEICMSRTGGVGSIGCVVGHLDASENMKQRGFKMTFISAPEGGDKTDGNPHEPLSTAARARMQDRVDELYSHFVTAVSQNRGMDEGAVIKTKARTFTASQATSNGLADRVASSEDSMAGFLADLSQRKENMTTNQSGSVDQAAHDKAVADAKAEGFAEGKAAGLTEGATAERDRIDAVTASEPAKDRPVATQSALKLNLSADATIAFLATLPTEAKEDPAAVAAAAAATAAAAAAADHKKPDFKAGMNAGGGANVQANTEAGNGAGAGGDDDQLARTRAMVASQGVEGFGALGKAAA